MYRAIIFFGLATSAFANATLDQLVDAATNLSVAIQRQLASVQRDPLPADFARNTIAYALAQMLGKQSPVPAAVASRRRLIERLQDPLLGGRIVFAPLFGEAISFPTAGDRICYRRRDHDIFAELVSGSRIP